MNEMGRAELLAHWWALVWGKGAPQIPPLRYATVGMTNLFGGTGLKASALPVHSSLNLPPGKLAPPNEQNGWGWICELTRGALVWGKGAPQIPPLRYATVGMTNLFGGTGLKASAHRVHSMLNLPTGESAARDDKSDWETGLKICLRDGLESKRFARSFLP